jgi:hypothetical protein
MDRPMVPERLAPGGGDVAGVVADEDLDRVQPRLRRSAPLIAPVPLERERAVRVRDGVEPLRHPVDGVPTTARTTSSELRSDARAENRTRPPT